MSTPPVSMGIRALGHAAGKLVNVEDVVREYTPSVEYVLGWGYRSFHRAAPDETMTVLAARAGQMALERAAADAGDIDLLVVANSHLPEYLLWDPAAELQRRLGAHRAEVLCIEQACISALSAIEWVAAKMALRPEYRTALIVAVNRQVDEYTNRMNTITCIYSDGASAALVQRDHPGLTWRGNAQFTDGNYADFFRLEWGGAARPFSAALLAEGLSHEPLKKVQNAFGGDRQRFLEFAKLVNDRNAAVVEHACRQAGITPGELTKLIFLNDNRRAFEELSETLSIPLARMNVELAAEHGHMGCADQFYCLAQYMERGELHSGDYVGLFSMGSGMHWACSVLRV